MTPSMMEFFKACMRPDPLQRASAKDLLEMAFMREGAWEVRMGTTVSLAGFYDLMQRAFAKDLLEMAFMREGAWEVCMGITVSFGGFSNRLRIVKKSTCGKWPSCGKEHGRVRMRVSVSIWEF